LELLTLIDNCKKKDNKAYEILYKKYYRVLYSIALRYARTSFEAEDILQDSFLKIFKSISSYQIEGSFEGWLKRIVQNTAINSYKSNLKFNNNIHITDEGHDVMDDNFTAIFETFETKDVLKLLNNLPDGYRMIINFYCIDGYTHKEIAEMLNISTGTSKSQLFKAKEYLKKVIEKQLLVKQSK
jgi:RNA polymerase sigma factor (sigma-70 family)